MSGFQKINLQIDQFQMDRDSKYFYAWIESQLVEKHKSLIIKELNFLKETLPSLAQENAPDNYVPFSKHLINAFYQAAYDGLKEGLSQEACHLFFILSHLLPANYDVRLGLGISYQLLEKHSEALKAFHQATNIHPQAFQSYLFSAESCLEIKDRENFEKNIRLALSFIPHDKQVFQKHARHLIEKFNLEQRN
jgi:tetratricopeptide (TPR) repeat protein